MKKSWRRCIASLFLQLQCVASCTYLTLQLQKGAAHLVEFMRVLEYLAIMPPLALLYAMLEISSFNTSQSLLVAEVAHARDNFCGWS